MMKQGIAYILTALILLGILIFLRPTLAYRPKGLLLPIRPFLTPNSLSPDEVVLYPPWTLGYQRLAWVNLELHAKTPSAALKKMIIEEAKKMAIQAGGNGLLILSLGYQNTIPQLSGYILRAVVTTGTGVNLS